MTVWGNHMCCWEHITMFFMLEIHLYVSFRYTSFLQAHSILTLNPFLYKFYWAGESVCQPTNWSCVQVLYCVITAS